MTTVTDCGACQGQSLEWWLEHGDVFPREPYPLGRFERSVLVCAYEQLRYAVTISTSADYVKGSVVDAMRILDLGNGVCDDVLLAMPTIRANRVQLLPASDARVLRARLALYLRSLLRPVPMESRQRPCRCGDPRCRITSMEPKRYRALWETAPRHGLTDAFREYLRLQKKLAVIRLSSPTSGGRDTQLDEDEVLAEMDKLWHQLDYSERAEIG